MVFNINERRLVESVHEKGAEEDIWAQEGGYKRKVGKLHNEELLIFICRQILFGWSNESGHDGGACRTLGVEEKFIPGVW